jgi:hypothetical protein
MAEKKSFNPRLLRWSLHLQGFDYTIKYRSGKLNKDGDALSRFPVSPGEQMDDNLERYCLTIQRSNKRSTLHNSFLSKEILSKEQKKDYHFGKFID